MQLEIGSIVEGKVVGITKFGAFVEIKAGISGLVHISEISKTYVTNVADFLEKGDIVKVKILTIDDNKIGLSIRQACCIESKQTKKDTINLNKEKEKNKAFAESNKITAKSKTSNLSFEEMLSKFKKTSEEKMSDIKKNLDVKQRNCYSKRR